MVWQGSDSRQEPATTRDCGMPDVPNEYILIHAGGHHRQWRNRQLERPHL